MKGMYCYHIAPIDFWAGWMTREQFITSLVVAYGNEGAIEMLAKADELLKRGKEFCKKNLLWEGDIREGSGPFYAALPDDVESSLMIAWKQDNNGSTFIVSEYQLPWLTSMV